MKIKATLTINCGLYMDIRPEIEIEVPDGLVNQDLVRYLHREYFGVLTPDRLQRGDRQKARDVGQMDFVEDLSFDREDN